MKYRDAVRQSMEELARMPQVRFIGYNLAYDTQSYGTLKNVSKDKIIEMPLAENLMAGMAMGMGMHGFRPVLVFERHDFVLNAMDCLVNHLDKLNVMSNGEYSSPVIVRAIVGGTVPLHPGPQHVQDHTEILKRSLSFPVRLLTSPDEIISGYREASKSNLPTLMVEKRDWYDKEFP